MTFKINDFPLMTMENYLINQKKCVLYASFIFASWYIKYVAHCLHLMQLCTHFGCGVHS